MSVVGKLAIVAILTISEFWHSETLRTTAVPPSDCIMVVGGKLKSGMSVSNVDRIEYYHPKDGVACNLSHILPTLNLSDNQSPFVTSGCYLFDTKQIVVRESSYTKSSMIYWLLNGTVEAVPRAHITDQLPLYASTSASLDSSRCLSCGGTSGSDECYEFNKTTNNKWAQIPHLADGVAQAASVSLGHFYYVIGGIQVTNKTKKLFRYDTRSTKWVEKKSMNYDRYRHSAAPLSDHEFITCGGSDDDFCEIYSETNDMWQIVGSLTTSRVSLQMVNFNGKVYAMGGEQTSQAYSVPTWTVEVFDRESENWLMVRKPLKVPRYAFLAFAITLPKKPTAAPPPSTPPPTTTKPQTTTPPPTAPPSTTPPAAQTSISETKMETSKPADTTTTTLMVAIKTEGTTEAAPISILWWILIGVGVLVIVAISIVIAFVLVVCCCKRRQRKGADDSERDDDAKIVLPSSIEYNPNWPRMKKNADGSYTDESDTKSSVTGVDGRYEPDTVTSHRINVSLPTDGEYTTSTEK